MPEVVDSLDPTDPATLAELGDWLDNVGPEMRAYMDAAGIDLEYHQDFERHYHEDPEEAERQTAKLEEALAKLRAELVDVEAMVELTNAVTARAQAEGLQSSWARMPKDARERGWHVSRRSRGRYVFSRGSVSVDFFRPRALISPALVRRGPRARTAHRQNVRSSSAASRDGPEPDEPELDPPAPGGRLGVEEQA